ncbi:hypothetical protein BV25DRAFT_1371441 [Artomyces pyxidatus]|uniref:Uncharacterized protein n=1 Tax=Artomyces pyxidatus TaxID=48021 RepID=A0ACB8SMY5_9AGAM|nr:hypothetical protein BV25DRAFT_1371441 [Artomyces pyxidatus]
MGAYVARRRTSLDSAFVSESSSLTSTMRDAIPFDVWVAILSVLDDRPSLSSCARVSRTFWDAATRSLYKSITVMHIDRGNDIRGNRAFAALKAHPHLRAHVRGITHSVMDTTLWKPFMESEYDDGVSTDELPWTTFIPLLPNLTSYSLSGVFSLSLGLIDVIVGALSLSPRLTHVKWIFEILPANLMIVMRLTHVREISIDRPNASALLDLGVWVSTRPSIEALHIYSQCTLS